MEKEAVKSLPKKYNTIKRCSRPGAIAAFRKPLVFEKKLASITCSAVCPGGLSYPLCRIEKC
jgi:hypothetical protein